MAGPELTQPVAQSATTRRAFLRRAGLGAAGLAIGGPALLAACTKASNSTAQSVRVYNEPLEIDDNTPALFEANSGVFLHYYEYTDAAEFLKRNTAALRAHRDIGADVVVLPDLQTAQMIEAGFARPLPIKVPNRLIVSNFANPAFDPGRRFSLPYSSTVVGLAYDRRRVSIPPTSVAALFNPRFAGKVVLSTDAAATLGLVMLASGQDPSSVTAAQAHAAVQRVRSAVESGQVHSFAGTEYIDELTSGQGLVAVARADEIRDSYSLSHNLQFVVPAEGGLLESTNMVVPVGAKNIANAGVFIRYMFTPNVNSRLSSYCGQVSPVVGAEGALAGIDVKAALDPLVAPPPAVMARLKVWGGTAATDAATSEFAKLAATHSSAS